MSKLNITDLIAESINHCAEHVCLTHDFSCESLSKAIEENKLNSAQIFAYATLLANKKMAPLATRNAMTYRTSNQPRKSLIYTAKAETIWHIDAQTVKQCIAATNTVIELIHDLAILYDVNIFYNHIGFYPSKYIGSAISCVFTGIVNLIWKYCVKVTD